MAVYRYSPSRRYRPGRYAYRYRYRRSGSGTIPPWLVITVGVVALAGAGAGTKAVVHAHAKAPALAANPAATEAIAFARAQLGKPYLWGGTGPDAFDCSGLMLMAYRAAGVDIPRTSQDQWALLPHVPASQVRPGDLVFFPGSDGTWSAPGHVAMVLSKTTMIQAYATGTPIEISPLNGDGAGGIVGYARPREPLQAAAAAPSTGGTVALGRRLAAAYGWSSGGQWACLYDLWEHESGWRMVWNYQGSGAYGIPQALPASKMASAGPDYMTNPATQIRWGLGYIADTYGTPCGAWAFETSHTPNWY